ncbi:SDR family NAD(P)-dependent oxidoreductase [Rhodococcus koreensis]
MTGTVAVVTGGTGTIGGEIARMLEAAGAVVAVWDRDTGSEGDTTIACNVDDPASVDAAMAATVDRFGVPRILVNAAGLSGGLAQRACEVTDDDWTSVLSSNDVWQSVFAVNVMGVVNTSRAFARAYARIPREGAGGAIVNITSISGEYLADPALSAYSASKAAVHMVTRVAAADFGPLGIRVNAVAPGLMESRMKPMPSSAEAAEAAEAAVPPPPTVGGDMVARAAAATPLEARPGRAEDIAQAVLSMLSADFVTGQILAVDGGLTQRNLTRSTL